MILRRRPTVLGLLLLSMLAGCRLVKYDGDFTTVYESVPGQQALRYRYAKQRPDRITEASLIEPRLGRFPVPPDFWVPVASRLEGTPKLIEAGGHAFIGRSYMGFQDDRIRIWTQWNPVVMQPPLPDPVHPQASCKVVEDHLGQPVTCVMVMEREGEVFCNTLKKYSCTATVDGITRTWEEWRPEGNWEPCRGEEATPGSDCPEEVFPL